MQLILSETTSYNKLAKIQIADIELQTHAHLCFSYGNHP